MSDVLNMVSIILISSLRMSIPMALTTVGAVYSVRSGISELGCEGMMIAGAFFGMLGSYMTQNVWLGLAWGLAAGVAISMVHGVLHISYRVNQTISGMSVNLLGIAIPPIIMQFLWKTKTLSPSVPSFKKINLPWFSDLPFFGRILGEMNVLFYLMLIIVVLSWLFFSKTVFGLRMRMVGENPTVASTLGIPVKAYKYLGTALCGALSGMGGAYLSLGQMDLFVQGMTAGRGYIAMVINAFGRYNPIGALGGSIFFGFFDSLQIIFQDSFIPSAVMMMTPYVFTLIVLVFGLKNLKIPAGVGKHVDEQ